METLFGGVAFALLMAAQVLAVIAVHAARSEDPSSNSRPNPVTTGPTSFGSPQPYLVEG
jgi:hypothetical protein